MNIRNLIFFTFIASILIGLTMATFISLLDMQETVRLFDQNQAKVPENYAAASMSKGTIILLLAVGVIGFLGVSRKRKNVAHSDPKKESTEDPNSSALNE
jgi:hypothetical protein